MEMKELRELQFRKFLYNTTTGALVVVKTPPQRFEKDDSKVRVVCEVLADKIQEHCGKELVVDSLNMEHFDDVLNAGRSIENPHLFAAINYMGIVVDGISTIINQGIAAQRGGPNL